MSKRTFVERLERAAERNASWVCVGLDPRPERFPDALEDRPPGEAAVTFLEDIIQETRDLVCAYKPNAAFFEALGTSGHEVLAEVLERIPDDVPVILDAKRGDIGSTQEAYARWAFDTLDADAVTVPPYMGWDSVEPFARRRNRGVLVLVRTSNPGARDLQDLQVEQAGRRESLYEAVARTVARWRKDEDVPNLGAVAGATYPRELARVRELVGDDAVLLVPGVGAQGGKANEAVPAAANAAGKRAVITSSRGILHAEDPREACLRLREKVRAAAASLG